MSQRRALAGLLLVAAALLVLGMPAERMPADPLYPQAEAKELVLHGRFHVTEPTEVLKPGTHFVRNPKTDRWYSKWGLLNTLLFAVPTAAYAALRDRVSADETLYVACLNVFNILCALGFALLLFGLLAPYVPAHGARALYVLLILFASFVWYYLRAQSIDIFQLLLFTGYLRCLFAWKARPRPAPLAGAGFLLGLCVLAKSAFLLFAPGFFWLVYRATPPAERAPRDLLRRAAPALVALLPCIAALLAANQLRYGAWYLSGYHQMPELQHQPWLDRNALASLYAALFDVQRGLLVHFPPLLLGALCFRRFWREFRWDALVVLAHAVPQLLLVALVAPLWHGEWCYGPRLLLFVTPLLALPGALFFAPPLTAARRQLWRKAAVGAVAALSLVYQLKVNLMPFFQFYELDRLLVGYQDQRYGYRLRQFMMKTHYGEIYDCFLELEQGASSHKALNLMRLYRPDLYRRLAHELRRRDAGLNLLLFR